MTLQYLGDTILLLQTEHSFPDLRKFRTGFLFDWLHTQNRNNSVHLRNTVLNNRHILTIG